MHWPPCQTTAVRVPSFHVDRLPSETRRPIDVTSPVHTAWTMMNLIRLNFSPLTLCVVCTNRWLRIQSRRGSAAVLAASYTWSFSSAAFAVDLLAVTAPVDGLRAPDRKGRARGKDTKGPVDG
jgi:hypothetical protein